MISQIITFGTSHEHIIDMLNKSINDSINTMIPLESIVKECTRGALKGHIKDNTRSKVAEKVEQPGQLLTSEDLGLDDGSSVSSSVSSVGSGSSTVNDDFGAGGGDADPFGKENVDEDFLGEDLAVGKNRV